MRMEPERPRPVLHDLIAKALTRAAFLQEESRIAVEDVRTSIDALAQTVATIQRRRAAWAARRPPPHDHPPK